MRGQKVEELPDEAVFSCTVTHIKDITKELVETTDKDIREAGFLLAGRYNFIDHVHHGVVDGGVNRHIFKNILSEATKQAVFEQKGAYGVHEDGGRAPAELVCTNVFVGHTPGFAVTDGGESWMQTPGWYFSNDPDV